MEMDIQKKDELVNEQIETLTEVTESWSGLGILEPLRRLTYTACMHMG